MVAFYEASVPLYQRGLNGLGSMLERAAAHGGGEGPDSLLGKGVAERLQPLSGQVRAACARAWADPLRALGREVIKRPKPEPFHAELSARVRETVAFLNGITPDQMNAAASGSVTLGSAEKGNLRTMSAVDFILVSSIPQFFFHLTTIYVIMRHHGVPLRKPDFLGSDAPH